MANGTVYLCLALLAVASSCTAALSVLKAASGPSTRSGAAAAAIRVEVDPPVATATVLRLQATSEGGTPASTSSVGALARLLSLAVPGAVSFRQQDVLDFVTERFSSAAALVGPATEVPLAASQPNITLPACTLESLSRPGSTCLVAGQAYTLSLVFAANGSLAAVPLSNVTLVDSGGVRDLRVGATTPSSVEVVWEAGSGQGSSSSGNTIQRFTVDISYSTAGNCALEPSTVEFDTPLLPLPLGSADFVVLPGAARRFELSGCWSRADGGGEHCIAPCTQYEVTVGSVGPSSFSKQTVVVATGPARFSAPEVTTPSRFPVASPDTYFVEVRPPLIWPDQLDGVAITLTDTYNGEVFLDSQVRLGASPDMFFFTDSRGAYLLIRLSGVSPFTTYAGFVSLQSPTGRGARSDVLFTSFTAPPDAPLGLTISQAGPAKADRVVVSWQPPPGRPKGLLTKYELFLGTTTRPDQDLVLAAGPDELRAELPAPALPSDSSNSTVRLRVRAVTSAGPGAFSEPAVDKREQQLDRQSASSSDTLSGGAVAGIVLGLVAFVAAVLLTLLLLWRRHKRLEEGFRVFVFPEADDWEMDRARVQVLQKLGSGAFGVVSLARVPVLALARSPASAFDEAQSRDDHATVDMTEVAIKECKVRKNEGLMSFVEELRLMKRLSEPGHQNVVRLLGVCTQQHPLMMVMEYCNGGDLGHFLHANRPTKAALSRLTWSDVIKMGLDIARGMEYLCVQHKFVHRDLAVRNCLVHETDTNLTVKVCDMGMSRDVHYFSQYRRKGELELPIRWMSPEALRDGIFSAQSDVWSYGVCLWELVTFGNVPYGSSSNEQVAQEVMQGRRLRTSAETPASIVQVMVTCFEPSETRPSFTDLVQNMQLLHEACHDGSGDGLGIGFDASLLQQPIAHAGSSGMYHQLDAVKMSTGEWAASSYAYASSSSSSWRADANVNNQMSAASSRNYFSVQPGNTMSASSLPPPAFSQRSTSAGSGSASGSAGSRYAASPYGRSPTLFLVIVASVLLAATSPAAPPLPGSAPFFGVFFNTSAGTLDGVAVTLVPTRQSGLNASLQLMPSPPASLTQPAPALPAAVALVVAELKFSTRELATVLGNTLLDKLVAAYLPATQLPLAASLVVVPPCTPASSIRACLIPGQPYTLQLLASDGSALETTEVMASAMDFAVRNLTQAASTAASATVSWLPPEPLVGNTLQRIRIEIRYAREGNADDSSPGGVLLNSQRLVAATGLDLGADAQSFVLRGCFTAVETDDQHCVAPYTLYEVTVITEGDLYHSRTRLVVSTAPGIPTGRPRIWFDEARSAVPGIVLINMFPALPSTGPVLRLHATTTNQDTGEVTVISPVPPRDAGPQAEPASLPASGSYARGFLPRLRVEPYTAYHVTLALETAAGIGPAWPLDLVSPGTTPNAPIGLTLEALDEDGADKAVVLVSWQPPPGRPRGNITQYELFLGPPHRPDQTPLATAPGKVLRMQLPAGKVAASSTAQVRVRARTSAGPGPFSEPAQDTRATTFVTSDSLSNGEVAAIVVGVLACAAAVILILFILWRRQKRQEERQTFVFPQPDDWEMDRARLTRIDRIGAGAFGVVHMGQATKLPHGPHGPRNTSADVVQVAIKECRAVEPTAMRRFAMEAEVLKRVSSPGSSHVVRLYGVCLQSSPMTLVLEYCSDGDVRQFLIQHRPSNWPGRMLTWIDLAAIARDIARGMKYLSLMQCVHCDLSCRNCLIQRTNNSGLIVKVADLGLAQFPQDEGWERNHVTLSHDDGRVPLRWMPPEVLQQRGAVRFTPVTDVWSFGVCIFEIVTFGALPYAHLQVKDIARQLRRGARLKPPEATPVVLVQMMAMCFQDASVRPPFLRIAQLASAVLRSLRHTKTLPPIQTDPVAPTELLEPARVADESCKLQPLMQLSLGSGTSSSRRTSLFDEDGHADATIHPDDDSASSADGAVHFSVV